MAELLASPRGARSPPTSVGRSVAARACGFASKEIATNSQSRVPGYPMGMRVRIRVTVRSQWVFSLPMVRTASGCIADETSRRGASMARFLTILLFAATLPLASSSAFAGERPGDAALGALSGAVVLGPIGAIAGAVVGYQGPQHCACMGLAVVAPSSTDAIGQCHWADAQSQAHAAAEVEAGCCAVRASAGVDAIRRPRGDAAGAAARMTRY